ncbi:SLBB domain-containing protein [Membranihabitans marinus]|uniref:SLBB domain-containing protein n=1 Tax=Membranihabitans marinus TaxID=1227546 RepID=UPI001F40023D|nr:SLBB domain-containing protein [Membranihabitans marinus]
MIRNFYQILIILFFSVLCRSGMAQNPVPLATEQMAKQELASRGLDEAEVQQRLQAKGFDVNNISPEQMPALEAALKEVIDEMESEKAAQAADQTTEVIAQPIPDSPEEAIGQIPGTTSPNEKIKADLQEKEENASVEEVISEAKSDFIASAQSDPSQIYGHDIFTNANLALYRNTDDIPTPPNYILGTGDELKISIFGRSQADFQYVIGKDGYIQPSQMGKIFLKGLSIEQARTLIRNRFSQRYSFTPEQFSVVLSTARTVTISIFGEVPQPGSYTISALNTAFNALVACGGPKANGSIRKIRLVKENGETHELDVYQYLSDPLTRFDYPIDNGDLIYVPFSKKIVSISGGVKRPMRYELKEDEGLQALIKLTGGLLSNAYTDLITINRQGENQRQLLELDLGQLLESNADYNLQDGDNISIKTQANELKSFVSIDGAVLFPGNYASTANTYLSTVLEKAQFAEYARRDFAYLIRTKNNGSAQLIYFNPNAILAGQEADILLQAKDRINIYSLGRFMDETRAISISGAVRHPITESFDGQSNIRLSDFIEMAGGLLPNATGKGLLSRRSIYNNLDIEYIPLDLNAAISSPTSNANLVLQPGDQIQAYNVEYYEEQYDVSIVGMVRNPQTFVYDESLTFQDIIIDAGGLLPQANRYGMVVRKDIEDPLIRQYEMIDVDAILSGNETFDLQPGDEIRIYNSETYKDQFDIRIVGSVKIPGNYVYDPSLSLKDALLMAGGLEFSANPRRVEVFRLQFNGSESPKTLVKTIALDTSGELVDAEDKNFQLEPFDIVIIRTIPDFRYQELVEITGQVKYPGPYVLEQRPERLDQLIRRAGGLLGDAFPEAATLIRTDGNITGDVVISLHKVMSNKHHNSNIILRKGDIIHIPKRENLVAIDLTATRSQSLINEAGLSREKINVNFDGHRSAAWYVRNYAGGFASKADRKSLKVIYPNGKITGTKGLWIFRKYPTVTSGSLVLMNMKPEKVKGERKEVDWGQVLQTTLTTTTILSTLVTTIVLVKNLK